MSVVVNEVRPGFYLDSVALMQLARQAQGLPGVLDAGLMIGTPANLAILKDAGLLDDAGANATPGDVVIALKATDQVAADRALADVAALLQKPRRDGAASASGFAPRTLKGALTVTPDANLALISVAGDFAAAEAHKALAQGLHVMIFSDNVPVGDEIALKNEGRGRNLFVMGPDCGTAIIAGVPLGFANRVPAGDIGLIGASGTGLQEVSCLIAQAGRGISHAIGTGGRDLSADVGAITTLMAIDALAADAGTRTIVLLSKPPERAVAMTVLDALKRAGKPSVVCFLGLDGFEVPANCRGAATLEAAAALATGGSAGETPTVAVRRKSGLIRGLFSGGTMAAEAQIVLLAAGTAVTSNVPVPGARKAETAGASHLLLDLGDDAYTRGRPHPMIDPAVRTPHIEAALGDDKVGAILLDVVLGTGGHADPARAIVDAIAQYGKNDGPVVVASVTGTELDPQVRSRQVATLASAGILVAPSNAAAARMALAVVR